MLAQGDLGRLFAVVHFASRQWKVTNEDLILIENHIEAECGDRIRMEKVARPHTQIHTTEPVTVGCCGDSLFELLSTQMGFVSTESLIHKVLSCVSAVQVLMVGGEDFTMIGRPLLGYAAHAHVDAHIISIFRCY